MPDVPDVSFARDILPMFTSMDVAHMRNMMDLSNRESVFAHASTIYAAVLNGSMPPPSSGEARWSAEMCATFKRWADSGGPP